MSSGAHMHLDYEVAKPSDSDDIVRLLASVFSESEPPAVALALSFRDMEQFLQLVVPRVLLCELTAISRSPETGQLTGVLLTDDFASPDRKSTRLNSSHLGISYAV